MFLNTFQELKFFLAENKTESQNETLKTAVLKTFGRFLNNHPPGDTDLSLNGEEAL